MTDINIYLVLMLMLLMSLLVGCNTNLYQIAYAPKRAPPEKAELNEEWNREKKVLVFSLDGVRIYVRSEINLSSRSETIFFVETGRTQYSNENGLNYISVSLNSKNSGVLISDISGSLSKADSKSIIMPERIYYANQQGCILNYMNSDEYILQNKKSIPIRQHGNFDGIKRWSKNKDLLATSCFQFIYPISMVIDSNTTYRMQIGKLRLLDGRELDLEIYLKPSYMHAKGY